MQIEEVEYFKYSVTRFTKSNKIKIVIGGLIDLFIQDFTLMKSCLFSRPVALIGTDIAITHVGWLLRIRSYVFNEDDFVVNRSFCKFAYPFASFIISPNVCNVGKYAFKKVGYEGYQKLAYLHPKRFRPDRSKITEYVGHDKYFMIRLVSLSAGHDIEKDHKGLSYGDLKQVIDIVEPNGKVFISSEKPLPQDLKKYSFNFPVNIIHHLMYYCEMFISDSQSMTVECCMLGVPNIRVNTFVGKISVLEELERKYQLTLGIHPDEKELLFNKVRDYSNNNELRSLFNSRREKMLSEKIDVTSFFFNLVTGKPN
ncbi:MAG: hypothetical protein HUU54_01305 [Ignavibacteriaceae bacterium]|nr:hypothetical protein [Ignavibacteriaceae bacterium]